MTELKNLYNKQMRGEYVLSTDYITTIARLEKKLYNTREVIKQISSMTGNPDAVDGCRLIGKKCRQWLEENE